MKRFNMHGEPQHLRALHAKAVDPKGLQTGKLA